MRFYRFYASLQIAVLIVAFALINGNLSAQMAEVRIVVTADSGSYIYGDTELGLDASTRVGSTLRYVLQARSEGIMNGASLGWIFYSPNNSITTGALIQNAKLVGKWATTGVWGFGPSLNTSFIDGILPDLILTAGAGSAGVPNTGGGGFQDSTFDDILEWTVTFTSTGILCFDSSFFPPATNFLAIDGNGNDIGPLWFGGNGDTSVGETRTESFCVNVLDSDCCTTPGDANHDGKTNVADIVFLQLRIFRSGPPPACCREADPSGDGRMNIADITFLIRRIFNGGAAPICGGPVGNC